ncbi:MAG: Fic family protein [Bacteroidetes bacterium]|nr:Fic family protein [Bacteroidota bacterium]
MYDPQQPYNDLPILPPKFQLSAKVYKKAISANRALAELKGIAAIIPNQSIILNSLILREAKDSSEVENIITTQDDLYKAFSTEGTEANPAVKEVLNYREALWRGYELTRENRIITTNILNQIQGILIQNNAGIRSQPGTTLKNAQTQEIIYTPPFGKDVIENKLKNLEKYINLNDEDTDPIIKMIIIHYQFESIHPYYDGNGRTGRILNVLYLIQQELLDLPVLYLSSYIIKHKAAYYDGLNAVRDNNKWEEWILYMLDAVEDTSKDTIKTIKAIRGLLDETLEKVKTELPKIYSKELVEVLFHQPYCKIAHLVDNGIVTRFAASKYLKLLEEIGVLKGEKVGRENLFINIRLYELLKVN